MTFKEICKNEEINAYLKKGDENLGQLGYTDHSQAHCVQVARQAGKILERFGYSDHEIELVKIAGYMHDIGNAINRTHHAEYGALLANSLLKEMDMPLDDRITIMSAIGNHDESTGGPEDVISAALIIADKTDVRRSRVREKERAAFDIHDRVNYAVTESKLKIEKDRSVIALELASVTAAAQKLGIHRNTMEYRLRKFNDLSGISNYTADIVERLLFTYKILDLYPEILEEKDIL